MKRIAALLLMGVFAGTVAAQDDSEYRVRYGDTLDVIAQEMDVSVACLAGANDLTNANTLAFGQVLLIPEDCSPYDQIESIIISNVEDLNTMALLDEGLGRGGGGGASQTTEDEEDSAEYNLRRVHLTIRYPQFGDLEKFNTLKIETLMPPLPDKYGDKGLSKGKN